MTTEPPVAPPDERIIVQDRSRDRRLFTIAATIGVLVLVTYGYATARWVPGDDLGLAILGFLLLLSVLSVLAVFGVRARAVAPFVVAALLVPWLVGGAAFVGTLQRAGSAFESATRDLEIQSGEPLPEEGVAEPEPGELDEVDPPPDQVEQYETPPADVSGAVPLGEPVSFGHEMGRSENEALWQITLEPLECGLTVLPDGDYSSNGSVIDAIPRTGFEFCLITTSWSNVGEVLSWPMPLGSLVIEGEQIFHENRDIVRGYAIMAQRGLDTAASEGIAPGDTAQQVDVYEVPAGAQPEFVWITRDQPRAVAATT